MRLSVEDHFVLGAIPPRVGTWEVTSSNSFPPRPSVNRVNVHGALHAQYLHAGVLEVLHVVWLVAIALGST